MGAMVRDVDDLDFRLPSHAQAMLAGLRSLCSQPQWVDVTLSAGGRDFPCHRAVLALCSPYFRAMFSGDFAEGAAGRVELRGVDPDALAALLGFAYTGQLTVNRGNVEALMRASGQLQFHAVSAACGGYLRHQIGATNCLGILEFAEVHGRAEVAAKARAFLLENFEEVQKHEEFLELHPDRLTACLLDENLRVRDESARARAALAWVGHRRDSRACHLPRLLGLARLPLVAGSYLTEVLMRDALVVDCPESRRLLQEVCEEKSNPTPGGAGSPRSLQEVLFVVGGRSLEDSDQEEGEEEETDGGGGGRTRTRPRNCGFYDSRLRQWQQLPDFPNYNKCGYSIVSLNNDVYITGGSRGSQSNTWSTTQTWRYVAREGRWITVAPMLRARTNHASAVLSGEIYVIGGTASDVVEVEHYDPYTESWATTPHALKYVTNFTAAACVGKLYVIGSCALKYNALTLQCFNPVIDSWSIICSPFIPKYLSSPRSVSMDGVIYLVADNTKKVYLYDPDANVWQKVQPLHKLHENGGLVLLGGQLYATGGHWKGMEGDYSVEVEVYSRGSDSWKVECFLPRLWYYSGCCTVFLDTGQWPERFPEEP